MTHNHICHHDHGQELSPQEIVAKGLKQFKEAGFKMTKKREEILTFLAEENRYLSAQAIHRFMMQKYPTMSYNTTYRNLYDFVETGLIEGTEYDNEQMFRITCGDIDHHHHHFICTNCGITIPIDACPMEHVSTDLSGVLIEKHRFEIFGKCADCLIK